MRDPLTAAERSALMSKVRGKGNRSTEVRVRAALIRYGISGWVKHPANVPGKPDFFFPRQKVALFIDGCFWHACPRCARRTPSSRATFWRNKIEDNKARDRRVRAQLTRLGYRVLRVWEHELRTRSWLKRLLGKITLTRTAIGLRGALKRTRARISNPPPNRGLNSTPRCLGTTNGEGGLQAPVWGSYLHHQQLGLGSPPSSMKLHAR